VPRKVYSRTTSLTGGFERATVHIRWATRVVFVIATFATVAGTAARAQAEDNVILIHVHGLGFSADGNELIIPSHHGLAVYRAGRWTKPPGPQHDYMGFVATKRGYYTSGHPAPGSGLINPFGLLRSDDNGKTRTKLGLEGQSDFHLLAARSNAVYVYNIVQNSLMDLMFDQDGTTIWASTYDRSAHLTQIDRRSGHKIERPLPPFGEDAVAYIAQHPHDARQIAIATFARSVFLSRDHGVSWKQIADRGRTL
jgi:hypothetical protein